uniref:Tubulin epsilon and delta complex 1 n=1 Tax=Nothoprocta perdicaria TaxID=30464 RepID=A0A8C6YV88_NOTPE
MLEKRQKEKKHGPGSAALGLSYARAGSGAHIFPLARGGLGKAAGRGKRDVELCNALGKRPGGAARPQISTPEIPCVGAWRCCPMAPPAPCWQRGVLSCPVLSFADAQVRSVKRALWYYGYGRRQLYGLRGDGSAGSRELLLAFSWLLLRLALPERLLARRGASAADEASVCTVSASCLTEMAPDYSLEDPVDVRYLQWLSGRLRFQWQSLHALHQEQCKLLHKIHLFTSGCHMDKVLGHLSVTETDLVRQPENYKQLLESLESETVQLEAFLEWKQLEQIYWQWMVMNQTMKTREEELQKDDFCAAAATKIQEAVQLKLLDITDRCAPTKRRMHGSGRLVFRSKDSAGTTGSEVIRELQVRKASLERELKQLRDECRQRMDEIAQGLDGVICVSP